MKEITWWRWRNSRKNRKKKATPPRTTTRRVARPCSRRDRIPPVPRPALEAAGARAGAMTARTSLLYSLAGVLIGVGVACSSPGSDELTAAREALGRGRYGEALERYTEVTIQAPGTPEAAQALYEVALIHYLQRRDVDAARSTFRKILLSYPDSAVAREARRLLARMYSEDLGEPEKAI